MGQHEQHEQHEHQKGPHEGQQQRHRAGPQEAFVSGVLERLQQNLASLVPDGAIDAVLEQARQGLRQGFAELDLVPRRELDAHLAVIDELRRDVEDLERRLRLLEGK